MHQVASNNIILSRYDGLWKDDRVRIEIKDRWMVRESCIMLILINMTGFILPYLREWIDGEKSGSGYYYYVDGSRYEGSWYRDDKV